MKYKVKEITKSTHSETIIINILTGPISVKIGVYRNKCIYVGINTESVDLFVLRHN